MTRSEEQGHPKGRDRRRVVIGAAAAVAVAVAVPVALSWRDSEPSAAPSRGSEPAATPSASGPARAALTADAADGERPEVAYVADGELVLLDGSQVPLDQAVSSVAPFGDRWLVAHEQSGQDLVTVLSPNGEPERSFPGGPSVAVSAAGLVATEDPDGQVVLGLPGEDRFTRLKTGMPMQDIEVVAIHGTGDCSARDRTCAVYYNELGDLGGGFRMRPSGPVWQYTRFRSLVSASSEGLVAGELAPARGRRCTGVFDGRERRMWQTCDHLLSDFSPDARFVVGIRPGAEGANTKGLSVLDARTGALVADFAADRGTSLTVHEVVWETATSLLATVRANGAWTLLRLTTDGATAKVADLGSGDGDRPPLRLPVTP
jgi:hypothetical protein